MRPQAGISPQRQTTKIEFEHELIMGLRRVAAQRKKFAYFSSGEVLPPRGLAAQLPVVR
jgi:hypothetical protein